MIEWRLRNNSWVKNLPVRPLAPRRKTPGQLYPTFRPPGLGQKFCIIEFIVRKKSRKTEYYHYFKIQTI